MTRLRRGICAVLACLAAGCAGTPEKATDAGGFTQVPADQRHAVLRIRLQSDGRHPTYLTVLIDGRYAVSLKAPPKEEIVLRVPLGAHKVSTRLSRHETYLPHTTTKTGSNNLEAAFEEAADHVLLVEARYFFEYTKVSLYRMDSGASVELEKTWTDRR